MVNASLFYDYLAERANANLVAYMQERLASVPMPIPKKKVTIDLAAQLRHESDTALPTYEAIPDYNSTIKISTPLIPREYPFSISPFE